MARSVDCLEELTMVPTKASQETGPSVTQPWELDSARTLSPRRPDCCLERPWAVGRFPGSRPLTHCSREAVGGWSRSVSGRLSAADPGADPSLPLCFMGSSARPSYPMVA